MVKTYEVKIFRKRGECETIRNLTPIQMVALEEVFSHYGVSYKKFTYDGNRLESVDWIGVPDLLVALDCLFTVLVCVDTVYESETGHTIEQDFPDELEQARAALAKVKGG